MEKPYSSAKKRERLLAAIANKQSRTRKVQTIPRREGSLQALPLSFAQERLWFLDQLVPGNPTYNVPLTIHLTGQLDSAVLKRCLAEIVRRHEILRTRFESTEQGPAQVVGTTFAFPLPVIDLTAIPSEQQQQMVEVLMGEQGRRPFDLKTGPLVRWILLRLGQTRHLLLFTAHHIVIDGWSLDVFYQELAGLYEAALAGKSFSLPDLPLQYADFGLWQRKLLQEGAVDDQLAYWQRHLQNMPPIFELPVDRPRPLKRSLNGARMTFALPTSLNERLHSLGQQAKATSFMILLAAFQPLLARYTHRTDIVVGTPIANRTRPEIEKLIGVFVNTIVLRVDLSGNPSFYELVCRVRKICLEAYANQDIPFERLVEVLQPERDMSSTPLIQVLFAFRNTDRSQLTLPGLNMRAQVQGNGTAKFDLMLEIQESEQGYTGVLEYSTDLFVEETIARLSKQYVLLISAGLANPETRLADLPLLTAEEQQHLVARRSSEPERLYENCIHQLFEQQVARAPEAIALLYEDQQMSYLALEQQANRLAHYLIASGVRPESRVGLYMERSLEMVVGILAIQKAGGAYVALDPSYPQKELDFRIRDSQITLLLAQECFAQEISTFPCQVLYLDRDWPLIARQRHDAPLTTVAPDNLAYVVYTSGSTGRAKGVMITHRALGNHMRWFQETFSLNADDKVLQKTPYSFDASVWEFYATLLTGGSLVMARPGVQRVGASLVETLRHFQISAVQLVPAQLQMLVDEPAFAACTHLRLLYCGGEELSPDLSTRALTLLPVKMYNLYGPSETCIDATFWPCTASPNSVSTPIGIPISNMQAYVLDASQQLVPPGVPGELYLGGVGLARGYLQRPELTAESFIPHPFATHAGERLYRSGDLVRYHSQGFLEFLGRIDQQVKIRGYRIELGEIEAVLAEHPQVRQCVVVVREIESVGPQLVAYVVTHGDSPLTGQALRAHLKIRLPAYKVPAFYVLLDALPLTIHGKINRSALPAPVEDASQEMTGAQTLTEELLTTVWCELLGLATVNRQENFFEIGGHSLLAGRLVARVHQLFQADISIEDVFESPTITQLAQVLEQRQLQKQGIRQLPPVATSHRQAGPLSFAQQRLWFLDQLEQEPVIHNIPLSFHLKGNLEIEVLERSLNEIIRRHEILRTTFQGQDGEPVQVIAPELVLSLPLIDLQTHDPETRQRLGKVLARQNAEGVFDLTKLPLMQVLLVRIAEDEHFFLLALHHILADGWSMSIFCRELSMLYKAFAEGQLSPLPALPLQYVDVAIR
ncbi:MAG TPA: amino acid adenylation domain-containing protein, partial [Ktedonobacteraceae bacterium]